MGDPCTLMITQESRFAQPQNQPGLLSNKTMQQNHETGPKTIKQWWPETHVVPSEHNKLMIPRLSVHIKYNNVRT